jgi:hypothetical protein
MYSGHIFVVSLKWLSYTKCELGIHISDTVPYMFKMNFFVN